MKKRKFLYSMAVMLALFVIWTILICSVDVKQIGPQQSSVGFATFNNYFHNLIGVNMALYTITDWLGIVPILFVLIFALQGLLQWIKRKSLLKIDRRIFVLGAFYVVVFVVFILFEKLKINYRPVLINGILEASYPSSTTMLVMCVMPTTILHLNQYIKSKTKKTVITSLISAFTIFMVVGRIISGVHWVTDIIGGILLSIGLVLMYCLFAEITN